MDKDRDAGARSAARNGNVVRRAIEEIWNRGDLALADELFTTAYANHGGLIPDAVSGPEAIKVGVALHRTAFPNLRVTVEYLLATEEMVALRWVARGGKADDSGDLANGTLAGMTFCRLVRGKIAESWTNWDASEVMRQLIIATGGPLDGFSRIGQVLN